MNCVSINNVLDYFVDERLTQGMNQKIEVHLNQCSSCFKQAAQLKNLKLALSMMEAPKMPPRVAEDLSMKLAEVGPMEPVFKFDWKLTPAYAMALAYLLIMLCASFVSLGAPSQAYAMMGIESPGSAYHE